MLWRILADIVMGLHLILIGFFAVSVVLLAFGFFKGRRNWKFFYYGMAAFILGLGVSTWTGKLKFCSITELEYMLRRLYDPSEAWIRSRSLLGTITFNVTGLEVPEYVFTIAMVVGIVVMIGSLVLRRT
jgi:hypothetical protein